MAAYALCMKHDQPPPKIYQLRIVLRDISPLIWRRLLVHSDTTLAHLHHMLQILFAWSDEHLRHFHIFGKDYGSNAADTRHVTLQSFAFQLGERFAISIITMPSGSVTSAWKRPCPVIPRGFIQSVPAANGLRRPNMCRMRKAIW